MTSTAIPPLLPKVDAILVLDAEGNRLAGKYYTHATFAATQESRRTFEAALQSKLPMVGPMPEVLTCQGRTAVACGSPEVRIVHIGPPSESELLLAYLVEGMWEALSQLMGGATTRSMVLDNLELVFLLIDEHCDGGVILETDGTKLAASVMLRDTDHGGAGMMMDDHQQPAMMAQPGGGGAGEMSMAQLFRQSRDQFLAGLASRDGM